MAHAQLDSAREAAPEAQRTSVPAEHVERRRLRLIFMGTPEIAIPSLRALVEAGHEIVGVVTQPDRPVGRSRTPQAPPVKIAALSLGLPVLQPERLRGAERIAELRALDADAIVVAAFGQILRPAVLGLTRLGCLNVHPSLLPALRGASPVNWAILEGLDMTGVTVMLLDEGMDTGPILEQVQTQVFPRDDATTLGERLGHIGALLLVPTLEAWAAGKIAPRPQDESRATYSRILARSDGQIDWTMPAAVIDRRIRAFVPWPGAWAYWEGRQVKLIHALSADEPGSGRPGEVTGMAPVRAQLTLGTPTATLPALRVATGAGVLAVTHLQMEGKRVTGAAEFARGYPGIVGAVLDSRPASP